MTMSLNNVFLMGCIKLQQAKESFRAIVTSEKGVTAIEYAVVIAGVAAVVMVIFGREGPVNEMLTNTFNTLEERINDTLQETAPESGGGE
ncbi:Flp pilus assembly protein, pilin Flp [Serratia fonticola]|uniref:Flp pilus assembly protein, pilin Flp n=1 Tax=Serratia fonticola TaxID=47917 RepID=A0A0F7HAQ8_SERFO|nr:Flp family type IVb pilin [Serratia fonticola]AKG69847.1 hypothetical protein WN53_12385 [Serratia fonticola]CAI1637838.1 Flp pilus assembly protein, pilin Flp [Serratia fonticola]VTR43923.1 Flp pilus assembly protein, pilin Flp [Serratia fonticola]